MTEEPQLGSIQERIAALKLSQTANSSGPEPPLIRPAAPRSKSANNPPSYNVTGSVLDAAVSGNEPAPRLQKQKPPPVPTSKPELKPKPKVPPPLPTRRSERSQPPPPPSRSAALEALEAPEVRPTLPPRRPTDPPRRPSVESVTSNLSHSTIATTATRGASTTSVNSHGSNRIKAPAWGETDLPVLPPKRIREELPEEIPPPLPESKSSTFGGLSAKISGLRGRGTSPAPSSSSSRSGLSLTNFSSRPDTSSSPVPPRLPSRRPSGVEAVEEEEEEAPPPLPTRPSRQETPSYEVEKIPPSLPSRRLPPLVNATDINNLRQSGFGGLNANPSLPVRPRSTPNGGPPPIPHGSRPDLSKLQSTKPRFNPPATATTECMVCRDFSGPDNHAAQYPRETLPTQDLRWLANELTAPFSSMTDKARAIFTWLHHNIAYDAYAFFNNCVKGSTPASTLSTGLAVCEGYAALFTTLATHAGLEAVLVSGHGKGYGYTPLAPGESPPPFSTGHAWNAVRIDGGKWKLIDTCWGAGSVDGASMFTMSNEEFGLKHFPSNRDYFFLEDLSPPSWEEYITTNPDMPTGLHPIKGFSDLDKHDIGRRTMQPANGHLSISSTPSPVRFQFGLKCEHWTLARHSRQKPGLFLLMIKGVDGRKDERLPFRHVPGSGPGGGGEIWYVDVPDARMLGAPGQKLLIAVLSTFGDRHDCRGLTIEEYEAQVGRVGMSYAYVAEWELVR
ncbi:hypothetical protein N7495_006441 [Penicillium taxi]|uniref:uncharacterized protein n=1 Tax=Penicillium taxi TaxID=168475 RepID=UPI002544D9F6|nr:uncharacterized protein N7495_006441 [Penicillium taxi]KAJ5894750.1 hypothetical protein N7495_006441 [Penicillium taxi]